MADADSTPNTLWKLFSETVEKHPNQSAVVFEDAILTRYELYERASVIASNLANSSNVAILLPPSIDFVASILACLKVGAPYVPLECDDPVERLNQIVAASRAKTIISTSSVSLEGLSIGGSELVLVDSLVAKEPSAAPKRTDDVPYIIFTSGSTGKPKGVMVTAEGLVCYLNSIQERLNLSSEFTFLHATTLSADLGNTVLFPPLVFGGTLHLLRRRDARDAQVVTNYIAKHGIDVAKITPSHAAMLEGVSVIKWFETDGGLTLRSRRSSGLS
ncbi:AMP-binding protein, partial [uncultured Tateyamaria sp.]|uniref:AMP-binding protein n=1 Tax=uncultured Tateyamaria sp. TaxID=455651 RepID=UPI002611825F